MRIRISPMMLGCILSAWIYSTPSFATQVLKTSVEQMTQGSDVILHGTVLAQKVQWNSAQSRVLTLTTLQVKKAIKGNLSDTDTVTVYQVGGTLDGVTYKIPGAIKLRVGEEIIFFGVRFRSMIASYGMGIGKFTVSPTPQGRMVAPSYGDIEFVTRDNQGRINADNSAPPPAQSLESFLSRIQAALKGGAQ